MAAAVAPGLPPRRSLRGVLIASAGCFLALALAVGFTSSLPGDTAVREALLALASLPVLAAMRLINRAGSWQLLLPGSLLLLVAFARARERWYVWVGLMIAAPATEGILKIIIGRPRPEAASMGFPSGHAPRRRRSSAPSFISRRVSGRPRGGSCGRPRSWSSCSWRRRA